MNHPRVRRNIIPAVPEEKEKFADMAANIIKISDIVLEILDARFIDDTRNKEAENLVRKLGKKLIFVLNKSDLVNINKVKQNLPEDLHPYAFVSCKNRKGIWDLRNMIKIEVRRIGDERFKRKHVGIIGYPNTGKSSLINFLIGRKSAKTSPEAGLTRGVQKIKLVGNILLIDTPGVIPEKEFQYERIMETGKHSRIAARTHSQIKDPESEVYSLTIRYPGVIEKFYGIESEDFNDFIEKLGRKKRFLLKGNVVDEDRTLRVILRDWQEGNIRID